MNGFSATTLPEGVTIGAYTYGALRTTRFDGPWPRTDLRIGKFCSLGAGFRAMLGSEHNTDWVSTFPFHEQGLCEERIEGHPKTFGDIEIGNDVWIGENVTVLSGAKIRDGAVIAAGSYVRGSVSAYTIYGGNPGRLLGARFRPDLVDRLLTIAWWDWPVERVRAAARVLSQPDVEAFCNAVERGEL